MSVRGLQNDDAISAQLLCGVHRLIGASETDLRILVGMQEHQPDADRASRPSDLATAVAVLRAVGRDFPTTQV